MKDWCVETFGEGSAFYAGLTLLRYPLGIAFFLLPWSMKFGGIVAGPILIAVFIVVNVYRGSVVSAIANELTANGVPSPSGCSDWWILENCLGKVRRTSVNCYLVIFSVVQWVALLGHASTFLAFAGLNINEVFPSPEWPGVMGDRTWIGICAGICVFTHAVTQWIRNMMEESACMCVNVCSSFFMVLLPAIFAIFFAYPTIVSFSANLAMSYLDLRPSINVMWGEFGLLLAGFMFTIGATPDDVTATYGAYRNRRNFGVVLLSVGAITMILGISFSITVFLGIGDQVCGSVTFNLPLKNTVYNLVRMLLSICALIFVSFRHQIEPQLSSRLSTAEIICDIVFKVLFLGVAGALAAGFPTFAGLACVFGSLTSFMLTLVFPFLCDLMLHLTGGRTPANNRGEEVDLLEDEDISLTRPTDNSGVERTRTSVARIIRDVTFILLGLIGIVYCFYTTVMHWMKEGIVQVTDHCPWTPFNGTMT